MTENDSDIDTDIDTDTDTELLSDAECREEALAGVRDAIAALQDIPAVGLDAEKHETLRESTNDLTSLERALTNEVSQMEVDKDGDRA